MSTMLSAVLCIIFLAATALSVDEEVNFSNQYLVSIYVAEQEIASKNSSYQISPSNYIEEVCFKDIGCFSKQGLMKHVGNLPESPEKINTQFLLYTKANPETPVVLDYLNKNSLTTKILDTSKQIIFLAHGFGSANSKRIWLKNLRTALIEKENVNVIVINWAKGAAMPFYAQAATNTELVGRQTARLLQLLEKTRNVSPGKVHFVGFSLGAQVGGFFGDYYKKIAGKLVGRITALDAAGPLFEAYGVHLKPEHAQFVDAIHTSAGNSILKGRVGMVKPIGHVDFYPNGGEKQTGCNSFLDFTCNHFRSHHFYLDSLTSSSCSYKSYPCPGGYDDFKAGKCSSCTNQGCGQMGHYSNKASGRGTQYLTTKPTAPFCHE